MTLLAGTLLAANLAIMVALTVWVAVRKHARDVSELEMSDRRVALHDAMRSGSDDVEVLFRSARRRLALQIDLEAALRTVRADPLLRLRAAETGLVAAVEAQLAHRRPERRGVAALLVGRLNPHDASAWLTPLLDDRDSDVRLAAAASLARVGDQDAARSLVAALTRGKIPPDRLVERLGGAWAVPTLIDALVVSITTGAAEHRAELVRALGLIGSTGAEAVLLALLAAPGADVDERTTAARALATCGSAAAVPALVDALGDDAWEVRAQAVRSLGLLGDDSSVSHIEHLLGDEAWWVRAHAARALHELGAAGLAALERALHSPDRFARERALEVIQLAGLERGTEIGAIP